MTDYKDFWDCLQLGKWRGYLVRKQVGNRLLYVSCIFIVLVMYYASMQVWLSYSPSTLPKVDFLTPLSITVTIGLGTIGIALGFQSYFIQKEVGVEIISYCGIIHYHRARTLVTFINKGESTAVIRNISLFVLKDIKGIEASWRLRSSGLPSFQILCCAPVFQGWRLLKNGESTGVEEEVIKRAIKEVASTLKNEENTASFYFSILVSDEAFDITDPLSLVRSILGGCKLGPYREIVKYAKEEMKGFPGLFLGGQRTYICLPANKLDELRAGKSVETSLVAEVPPDVTDMNFEIWKKLDSIEKLLLEMMKKNKAKGKRQKPSNPS